MRRIVVVPVGALSVAGALALQLAAGAPAEARSVPKVLTQDSTSTFGVRPSTIGYTGDGTGYIGKKPWGSRPGSVKWGKWNHKRARGVGTIWLNNCSPDCSRGEFRSVRGTVKLTKPKHGRFTRMTLRFNLRGEAVTDQRKLRHIDTYYRWM